MKKYYLYLDESGKFQNDKKYPPIVAGLLMKGNQYNEARAKNLFEHTKKSCQEFSPISIDPFHGMREKCSSVGDFIVAMMEGMQAAGGSFVEFQSTKTYLIVNSDITYLNVFTQGLINLIQDLLAGTGEEIELNVLYAHRVNMQDYEDTGLKLRIMQDDYTSRLEEKLDQWLYASREEVRRRVHVHLETDSATESYRLMLADLVCSALRGSIKKLSEEQIGKIRSLDIKTYPVGDRSFWDMLRGQLAEGRLGEAIYTWYINNDITEFADYRGDFENILVSRLGGLSSSGRAIQFKILSELLKDLNDTRDCHTMLSMAKRFAKCLFPLLAAKGIKVHELEFDVHFHALTAATHLGLHREAEESIAACREALKHFPITYELLDYYLSFKLRVVEHLKNSFAFAAAVADLDKLEDILGSLVDLVKMIDSLGDVGEGLTSTTLGRVLNSRVSLRSYRLASETMTREEFEGELIAAQTDSDLAGENFTSSGDRSRLAQARCQLECSAGDSAAAYECLAEAFGLPADVKPKKLMQALTQGEPHVFGILHYANLMALLMAEGKALGWDMLAAYDESGMPEPTSELGHPRYLIAWRVAQCRTMTGEKNGAESKYELAMASALKDPAKFAVYAAGLAIEADRIARLKPEKSKPAIMQLKEHYEALKEAGIPEGAGHVFAPWEETLVKLPDMKKDEQWAALARLSRSIPIL